MSARFPNALCNSILSGAIQVLKSLMWSRISTTNSSPFRSIRNRMLSSNLVANSSLVWNLIRRSTYVNTTAKSWSMSSWVCPTMRWNMFAVWNLCWLTK